MTPLKMHIEKKLRCDWKTGHFTGRRHGIQGLEKNRASCGQEENFPIWNVLLPASGIRENKNHANHPKYVFRYAEFAKRNPQIYRTLAESNHRP